MYYEAIVNTKTSNMNYGIQLDAKVHDNYYVHPRLTFNQWDSLQVGDSILIHKTTYKLK